MMLGAVKGSEGQMRQTDKRGPAGRASRRFGAAAMLAAALMLAGCASLARLEAVTSAVDLYDLSPKSTFDPDLPEITAQLVIEEPTAGSAVNTDRIAVRPTPLQVQYFPEGRWIDRAPALVQTLLIESFENTGRVLSVGRQAVGLAADYTLVSELREFEARVRRDGGDAPLEVMVVLNVKIVRNPEGRIIASRSFEYVIPTGSGALPEIVAAFDEALGKTMRRAVEWTIREIAAAEAARAGRRGAWGG